MWFFCGDCLSLSGLANRHGAGGGHFVAALACRSPLLELAYQPVEIAQLVDQLGDAVHGVLAANAGVIGQGLDAEHVAVDLGGDVELLLHRLGNLAAAGGHLLQHIVDLLENGAGRRGFLLAAFGELAALLHRLLCIPGAGLQLGDHLLDLAGRGLGLDGEGADLVCDH